MSARARLSEVAQLRTGELLAAAGDRDTLLTLSRRAMDDLVRDPRQAIMWITQAVVYARLAAINGGGIVELRHVASTLFFHAQMLADQANIAEAADDPEDAEYYVAQSADAQTEAMFWLSASAELGDEVAAEIVRTTPDASDPRIPEHLSIALH